LRKLLPEEEDVVKPVAEYRMFTGDNITREVVARETKDVDAVSTMIPSYMFLDAEILRNAKKLKVINVGTNTFDIGSFERFGLDVGAATKLGIFITNVPLATEGIADKTWALLLAVARRILEADKFTREGQWKKRNTYEPRFVIHRVYGKTLGIVGLGRIGKAVAERAKGFKMRVIYYDIARRKDVENELGIEYADFETLLRNSDFVSVNTGPVHHLISEKELGLMKRNAILVNTARGECVDSSALYRALKENRIAGAALDVFEKEPPDPDDPLFTLPNVVLTPHSAEDVELLVEIMRGSVQNILDVVSGKVPLNRLVNKEVTKTRPPSSK
jgi:glyoxylate reductase